MSIIKIISNPYNRNLDYFILQEQDGSWLNIAKDSINSRLRETDEEKIFLPFKVKEILDTIVEEYYVGTDPIEIVFEGATDEYEEVLNVCNEEDFEGKIHLTRSPRIIENARDILEYAKAIFANVHPIIQGIVKDDPEITKGLDKVSDALLDIIPICIFGNYSAGKSTFINSLIGYEILPSGGDPVTSKIYEIKRSAQQDRARIGFTYLGVEYDLLFTANECQIKIGDKSVDLIQEVLNKIESLEEPDMFRMVYETVEIINSFERRDKAVTVIGNVIKLEVPFSKAGVIAQSQNKFVIFDTPGSNSNTNMDHEKVLSKSLEGFSNGIPIWVSSYDSIDSVDNARLCEKLYQIDALDKRFTMIVVNKADSVELPKNGFGEKEIAIMMEYESVEKMYSSGIYFVSSIMGLGTKNLDGVISEYILDVYDEKERKFSDPNARAYKKLYEYNIMPEQMKKKAIQLSEACDNRIYANSGLFCIETEMEQFASKHSAYNKCQMVYMFLRSVIAETDRRINEKASLLERNKKKWEQDLDAKKFALVGTIRSESVESIKRFDRDSKAKVKEIASIKNSYERTPEAIESIDNSIAKQHEQNINFASYERDLEEAKNNRWKNLAENSQNLFKGDFFHSVKSMATEWANDSKSVQKKKESMDTTRQTVDKATSDRLLQIVIDEFKNNLTDAQDKMWDSCLAYWQYNAQTYCDTLSRIIMGSDALNEKQRTDLYEIIRSYPLFKYDDQADRVFIKAKFLRGSVLGIKIGSSERLNTARLASSYNNRIKNCVDEMSELINNSCFTGFKEWQQRLQSIIEENLTIYNPELRELTESIREEEERISELRTNQQTISNSLSAIEQMMSWRELE